MLESFIKRSIASPVLIYIIRCLIGFAIGYLLYIRITQFELFWALLSVMLVISPEEKDSKRLSIERFKSNLVGSSVALFCILIHGDSVYMIMLGIVLAILICRLFKIMNMARVAIVALLVIMIPNHAGDLSYTPILRSLSVGAGCLIGLSIVMSTSYLVKPLKRKYGIPLDDGE